MSVGNKVGVIEGSTEGSTEGHALGFELGYEVGSMDHMKSSVMMHTFTIVADCDDSQKKSSWLLA